MNCANISRPRAISRSAAGPHADRVLGGAQRCRTPAMSDKPFTVSDRRHFTAEGQPREDAATSEPQGVIDEDYRGPIGVLLVNNSDSNYSISPGDRIAQLILEQCSIPIIVEMSSLPPSSRDASGFGSTGI